MQESTYENHLPSKLSGVAATGYLRDRTAVPGRYHTYPEMAAAGLWTTASELARFGIEIQKSREGRSNRILKQTMVQTMLTEQKKPYGLGFSLAPNWFSHGGADEGFQASFGCSLDGKGIVIMTNSDNGGRLAHEIELGFAAAYGLSEKPVEREMTPLARATALSGVFATHDAQLLLCRPRHERACSGASAWGLVRTREMTGLIRISRALILCHLRVGAKRSC
jgi:CubicO group peptidase (beta-lactamase class C family)